MEMDCCNFSSMKDTVIGRLMVYLSRTFARFEESYNGAKRTIEISADIALLYVNNTKNCLVSIYLNIIE